MTLEELQKAVKSLSKLLDNPEPGIGPWHNFVTASIDTISEYQHFTGPGLTKPNESFVSEWVNDRLTLRDDPSLLRIKCRECKGVGKECCPTCHQHTECVECDGIGVISIATYNPNEEDDQWAFAIWRKLATKEFWHRHEEEKAAYHRTINDKHHHHHNIETP